MAMTIETVYAALDALLITRKTATFSIRWTRRSPETHFSELKLGSYEKQAEHYEFSGMSECSVRLCSRTRTDQRHHCGARPV